MRKLRKGERYALWRDLANTFNKVKRLPRHCVPRNDDYKKSIVPSNGGSLLRCAHRDDVESGRSEQVEVDLSKFYGPFKAIYKGKYNSSRTLFSLLMICSVVLFSDARAQSGRILGGEIRSAADGQMLEGVSIYTEKGEKTSTDRNGKFSLRVSAINGTVHIKHIGFALQSLAYDETTTLLKIELVPSENQIDEVEVINTGYQRLTRERSVGAFDHISTERLQHQVQPNILERLEGMSTVLFDRRNSSNTLTQVRGVYSIVNEIVRPLIILDNFPYEGDISNINPEDIASITILKDAAAASIWGTRAGNGVIVITSKTGKNAKGTDVNWSSNLSVRGTPDLLKRDMLSPSDVIDLETQLFKSGYFDGYLSSPLKMPVSQVVEILESRRNGQISPADSTLAIDGLRKQDVRSDFMKYVYRNMATHQHTVSMAGNIGLSNYRFSAGYNQNISELAGDENDRMTVRWRQDIAFNNRLNIDLGTFFASANRRNNSLGGFGGTGWSDNYGQVIPIYSSLKDEDGQSAVMLKRFRSGYTDALGSSRLYDWNFRPLEEISIADNSSRTQSILLDAGLNYKLYDFLSFRMNYQYQQERSNNENNRVAESYFVRDLINNFTNLETTDANLVSPIPRAGILDYGQSRTSSHNGRIQLDWNKTLYNAHNLSGMLGSELRSSQTDLSSARTYGYDRNLNTQQVNYTTRFPRHVDNAATIPYMDRFNETNHRFVSVFGNINYTLGEKYTAFASFRNDASNIFGVKTRDKWSPLWSVGGSWHLSKEKFYRDKSLPDMKLRATYGYSGNVYHNQSAYTTLNHYSSAPLTLMPYATILNPSNPNLRWEKVRTINLGMDVSVDRLRLSVDYYRKRSTDVFATQTLDPTTGINNLLTNSANLAGNGFELSLNSTNIRSEKFLWNTDLIFSYNAFKVTAYLNENVAKNGYVSDGNTIYPYVGFNPYMVVSHKWGGLNPETGAARGILNSEPSEDYNQIILNSPNEDQVLHGAATPPYFGNIFNVFRYADWSLSFNVIYKFGYYFRKPSVNYYRALQFGDYIPTEYLDRWKNPGDERTTDVPAFIYPAISAASSFYEYAEINVDRGDHIRLRDIRIAYKIPSRILGNVPIRSLELGGYYMGDHLLWKRNRFGLDPDNPRNEKLKPLFAIDLKIGLK